MSLLVPMEVTDIIGIANYSCLQIRIRVTAYISVQVHRTSHVTSPRSRWTFYRACEPSIGTFDPNLSDYIAKQPKVP